MNAQIPDSPIDTASLVWSMIKRGKLGQRLQPLNGTDALANRLLGSVKSLPYGRGGGI